MTTEQSTIYLGLGSNLGNRAENLKSALDMLSHRLRPGKVSSIYDTEPIGNVNQPRFLNMVCQAYTMLSPHDLLALTQGIELRMGRARGASNLPRPIDIDILFYGNQVIDTPELVIPHPRLHERAFVLVPMVEIAPVLKHPVIKKTVKQLLKNLGRVSGVSKWEGDGDNV